MADETYYSLLEISETASAAEIRTAYHRLIREVHPDRLANAPAYWQRQAEEKAKEINEAFAVLSNPARRRSYDAQLDAYRRSQSTASRQTTSRASTPSPASSTQQQSQTSTRSQYSSGAGTSSTQTPHSTSQQHQAASTSAGPTNVPSQSSSQAAASRLNERERFFFALICCLFGFGAAGTFWTSYENDVVMFLLATVFLSGVAYLYQRRMSRMFLALRIRQAKQQLGVTIGIIVLVLFVGRIPNMIRDTHFRGPEDHKAVSYVPQAEEARNTTSVGTHTSNAPQPVTPSTRTENNLSAEQRDPAYHPPSPTTGGIDRGEGYFQHAIYPHGYLVDELCVAQEQGFCYPFQWRPWIKDLEEKTAGEQVKELKEDTGTTTPGNLVISWDSEQRVVFWGCRPHSCPDASAYFIVAPSSRVMDIVWQRGSNVTYLGPHADLLKNAHLYEWLKNLD